MRPWSFRRGVLCGIVLIFAARLILDRSPLADWIVSPLLSTDTQGRADAIVVPGAGLVGPCLPNLSAVRRVLTAADLWREGRAPYLVMTGGAPGDLPCAVSDVMSALAVRMGVPADRVLTEATSRNTRENAYYAVPVLQSLDARRVVLVTDRLHMRRAGLAMGAQGYDVERVSVPVYATHHGNLDMLAMGLREYAALAYYKVRGWLTPVTPPGGSATEGTTGMPNEIEITPPTQAVTGPIVILGASYAEGWKPAELAGVPVINRGVAGQQSFEMLERFDRDVVASAPRAVVAWGFINDVFRSPRPDMETALARARDSYTAMIAQGRAAGIEVILATEVTVTGRGEWMARLTTLAGSLLGRSSYQDYVNTHVVATNQWIRETAAREGLLLLDFERVVSGPDGRRRREFAQPDGSHLTEAAYAAMTRYAEPILARHFGGRPAPPAP